MNYTKKNSLIVCSWFITLPARQQEKWQDVSFWKKHDSKLPPLSVKSTQKPGHRQRALHWGSAYHKGCKIHLSPEIPQALPYRSKMVWPGKRQISQTMPRASSAGLQYYEVQLPSCSCHNTILDEMQLKGHSATGSHWAFQFLPNSLLTLRGQARKHSHIFSERQQ